MSNKTVFKTQSLRKDYEDAIASANDMKMNIETLMMNDDDEALKNALKKIEAHINKIEEYISRIPDVAKVREKDGSIVFTLVDDNVEFVKADYNVSLEISNLIVSKYKDCIPDFSEMEAGLKELKEKGL